MQKPYEYIVSLRGKVFGKKILSPLNSWLGVDKESCEIIDYVLSMLYKYSLL